MHMLIVRDTKGRVLLEKRPAAGIWGGLWCLPEGDSPAAIAAGLGFTLNGHATLASFEHRLSHLRLDIRPSLAAGLEPTQVKSETEHGWFDERQQRDLGLPRPVALLLQRLNTGELT